MSSLDQVMRGQGAGAGQQTKSQPRSRSRSGFLDSVMTGSGQSVGQQHLKQPEQPQKKAPAPQPSFMNRFVGGAENILNKVTQNPVVKKAATVANAFNLTNPITAPIALVEKNIQQKGLIKGIKSTGEGAIATTTQALTGAPKHAAAPAVQDVNPQTKQLTPQFYKKTGTSTQQFKPKTKTEQAADLAQGVVNIDTARSGFGGEGILSNALENALAGGTASAASAYASGSRGEELAKAGAGGALTGGALSAAGNLVGKLAPEKIDAASKVNLAETATGKIKPKAENALNTLTEPTKSVKDIAPLVEKAPVPKPRDEQIIEADKAKEPTVSTFEGAQPIPTPTAEPKPLTPIGEGATKTSKLASGVETRAVEKKLTTSLGDLPEYKQVNMKDQAARSTQLLESEPDRAIRIATGQERAPDDVLPESIFTAVENKAVNEGDVETLRQLASGTRPGEATAYGQHIRALAERDPNSVVGAIKEIADTRGASADKQAIKAATSEIKKSIPRVREKDWNSFAESLAC